LKVNDDDVLEAYLDPTPTEEVDVVNAALGDLLLNESATAADWHRWRAITNSDDVLEYFVDPAGQAPTETLEYFLDATGVPEYAVVDSKHGDFILNETTEKLHKWRAHQNSDDKLEYMMDATGLDEEATRVWFIISGSRWVQKPVGKDLALTWDVIQQGRRIFRTLLLCKAT
jgi:hypothetical protein